MINKKYDIEDFSCLEIHRVITRILFLIIKSLTNTSESFQVEIRKY